MAKKKTTVKAPRRRTPDVAARVQAEFAKSRAAQRRERKRPTVLVAGFTGSGKTTLIQSICGKEIVSDKKVGAGRPKTKGFDDYENEFIRFYDSRGMELGETKKQFLEGVRGFIRSRQTKPDVDNHVHVVWYAIEGPRARVTDVDVQLVRELASNVIVVLTKADITKPVQRDAMVKVLTAAGVDDGRILSVAEDDHRSLVRLVDLTYEILPEAYREAFVSGQRVSLDRKKKQAQIAIHAAATAAAAAAAIPLPFSDSLIITPIQVAMVVRLAYIYGEPDEGVKASVLPVLAEAVGIQTAASLTKFLPFVGSAIGAGVAAALTEALGQILDSYLAKRFEARIEGREPPHISFRPGEFLKWFRRSRKEAQEEE